MHVDVTRRVLLVDDDSDVRFLVAEELERRGYEVVQAENGLQALDAVAKARPSIILLDMRMPVMDGWQFASELRGRYGRVAPLVVMTAATDARERAHEVGADAWLAKPFDLDALIEAVEHALA